MYPPQRILDISTVVQDGEKIILSRNEEQRLRILANGSNKDDYESSGEEENDGKGRHGNEVGQESDTISGLTSTEKTPGLSRVKLCSSCTFSRLINIPTHFVPKRRRRVTR